MKNWQTKEKDCEGKRKKVTEKEKEEEWMNERAAGVGRGGLRGYRNRVIRFANFASTLSSLYNKMEFYTLINNPTKLSGKELDCAIDDMEINARIIVLIFALNVYSSTSNTCI